METTKTLSNGLITVMAAAIGIIVANLYYLQPLLHQIALNFQVGTARASLLLVLIQTGYVLGLAFIVPLGDIWPRRRLAIGIFALSTVMMALAATLASFTLLAVVTFVIGLTSIGGHVIIPLAADLAAPGQRGRVIARVMTGLLLGILLSRTASGLVAEVAGWRAVYVAASALLGLTTLALYLVLPGEAPREHVAYRRLIASVFSLFVTHRQVRRRSYFGFLIFACSSALWTCLSFLLAGSPFHYSNAVIGLFGLFGVAGVLAANAAGHQADKQRTHVSSIVAGLMLLLSFLFLALGTRSVLWLILGIVVLDAGMQGLQITNQSVIYGVLPKERSRVNSAYMVSAFAGASLGSYAAGELYAHFGWHGDCWLGAIASLFIVVPALLWRSSGHPSDGPSAVVVER